MSSSRLSSTREEQDNLDENKLDFAILKQRLESTDDVALDTASSAFSATIGPDPSVAEVWPLQLVTVFVDHYIFGNQIGTGSYAEVRECVDTRTLQRAAVKIVNKEYLRRQAPSALANQLQEIRLLRQFRHTNIISMYECLFKGPKIYIILEYCPFVLHDLIFEHQAKGTQLALPLTRNLFRQLVRGIEYLHSIGVVHRDIKPQNLLITTCGILKIIDFGVSHVLSMWSRTDLCSNHEGSPLFQAPEVIAGHMEYAGFKVDVWSAGVTLFLMLYGQYPFMDESLLGLYDRILGDDFEPPSSLQPQSSTSERYYSEARSPVLIDLLAMMLEKEHAKRASVGQILNHPWLKLHESFFGDEHSEFIGLPYSFEPLLRPARSPADLVQSGTLAGSQVLKEVNTTSQLEKRLKETLQPPPPVRDIYKSMTVLPYLHSYHYSHLTAKKTKRAPSAKSVASSESSTRSMSPYVSPQLSPVGSNPHELISDQPIEWGTEEQYNLLKIPQVRANRLPIVRRRKPAIKRLRRKFRRFRHRCHLRRSVRRRQPKSFINRPTRTHRDHSST